ncbi:MAG: Nif3-like dinuclear metal center hexameric protein [Candidatus Lokiarchaeota archaeon]|nr:Nif3-like dinuclear metal center hexameric protein [Candidatus Lokiarchaeota archaeon]
MLLNEILLEIENHISPKIFKKKRELYGIQYGEKKKNKIIKKILLTVDLNLDVIHYAIKHKIDLILSYHGIINSPINNFDKTLINKLNLLSRYPINIFILGSPFISSEEGISETISKILCLRIENVFSIKNYNNEIIPIGRLCSPIYYPNDKKQSFTLEILLQRIKTNLNMNEIYYSGNLNKELKKICIVGGYLNNILYLKKAEKKKCDCYISCNTNHKYITYGKEIGLDMINLSYHNIILLTLIKLQNYLSLEFPYSEFLLFESDDLLRIYL